MVLGLPPFHMWPLFIPGMTGLVWLIDGSRPSGGVWRLGLTKRAGWAAFSIGWWFGTGFFMAGLYWISYSFLVDATSFAWMIPFAIVGLSALMAIYIGLGSWAAFLTAQPGLSRVFGVAIWWVAFEWGRGWAFTGFPWNLLGTAWTNVEGMLQVTAYTGVFGLSLVTALAAAAPAALGYATLTRRIRWNYIVVLWAVLAAVWIGGEFRLQGGGQDTADGVRLRLVQPKIAQRDKWKPDLRRRHFDTLLRLSREPAAPGVLPPTHVIWPETATPLFLSSVPEAVRIAAQAAPVGGALLTGAPRQSRPAQGPREIWNSFHVVNAQAQVAETYDKYHLVPFGEYVPFKRLLNISALTGRTDFSPGPGPRSLSVPGAPPVTPLICYEAVFPGKVTPEALDQRPGWLLNLTNDAWFGVSTGPFQHFAATQLRAVEEGIPLVRVANTGISGVMDAYGRVIVQTKLEEQIAVDTVLPKALEKPTWFARHGNVTFLVITIILFGISRIPRMFPGE